jgi:hypothetical protein
MNRGVVAGISIAIATIVAVAVGAVFLLLRDEQDTGATVSRPGASAPAAPGSLPYTSYYFEASLRSRLPEYKDGPVGLVRGWYEAPSRTRWEIGTTDPANADWVRVLIITETGSTFYEPTDNTYVEEDHAPGAQVPAVPYPLLSNIAIGPLVSYLDPATSLPAGTETILGVKGDVYKQGTQVGSRSKPPIRNAAGVRDQRAHV